LIILISLVFLLPQGVASPSTYYVPIDYPTIQDAVNNVPPGSTIRILGTVNENGIVVGKTLTIEGGTVYYDDDWGFLLSSGIVTLRDITLIGNYMWYNSIISPTFTYSASVGIVVTDATLVVDNVTIRTVLGSKEPSEKITIYYGIVGRERSIVRGSGLEISDVDIGIEMTDTSRSIDPRCYTIDTPADVCQGGYVDKTFRLDISNVSIRSDIGLAIFSTYPNDYARTRNYSIEAEVPILVHNIYREGPRDYTTYIFERGVARSIDYNQKLKQPYGVGAYIRSG